MGQSCNINARVRDRETGKQTLKLSILHKDLLKLNKFNKLFGRKLANRAYFLTYNKQFMERHEDNIIFDENLEPKLASLFEEARDAFPEVTFKNMRDFLSERYQAGEYSYEEAYNLMQNFNKEANGARTFIGHLSDVGDGKVKFSIEYATKDNIRSLRDCIAAHKLADSIIKLLEKYGVGVKEGLRSLYSTKGPQFLSNGLLGLILLSRGASVKELSLEAGHLIIGGLGKNNPLVDRLINLVKNNREAIIALLGIEEDLANLGTSEKSLRELAGHLVGKYLEKYNLDRTGLKGVLYNFGGLLKRGFDFIKSRLHFNNREFHKALYESKYIAKKMVMLFAHEKMKDVIENALATEETLESSTSDIVSKLIEPLQKLDLFIKTLGDKAGQRTKKALKDNYKTIVDSYRAILEKAEEALSSVFAKKELEGFGVDALSLLVEVWSNELNSCRAVLELLKQGIKEDGEPITLTEKAKALRYIKEVRANYGTLIEILLKIRYHISTGNAKDGVGNLLTEMTSLLNSLNSNEILFDIAINEVLTNLCLDLLTGVNGSRFIPIERHLRFTRSFFGFGVKRVTEKDALIDLKRELTHSDIDPVFGVFSTWINGLAESPDPINLLVYELTSKQRLAANKRCEEFAGRLDIWGLKCHKAGVSMSRFFDTNAEGELTGELVSKYNWDAFNKAKREFVRELEDEYMEANGDLFHNDKNVMWDSLEWQAYLKQKLVEWNNKNTKEVPREDARGNVIRDEDGNIINWRVPNTDIPAFKGKLDTLSSTEKALLLEYLIIKEELDRCLPPHIARLTRPPQFSEGFIYDMAHLTRSGHSVGDACMEVLLRVSGYRDRQDVEFGGDEESTGDPEEDAFNLSVRKNVNTSSHINDIRAILKLPIWGAAKLKDARMVSLDLVMSTIAYARMATNHEAMESVVDGLELLRELMLERTVGNENASVKERLLGKLGRIVKKVSTYFSLIKHMQVHVYGNYDVFKNQEVAPLVRVFRKITGAVTRAGTLISLGGNFGAASVNAGTAFNNLMLEASTSDLFGFKEFSKAAGIYGKQYFPTLFLKLTLTLTPGKLVRPNTKIEALKRTYNIGDYNTKKRNYTLVKKKFALDLDPTEVAMVLYSESDEWAQAMPFMAKAIYIQLKNTETGEVKSLWDAWTVNEETGLLELKGTWVYLNRRMLMLGELQKSGVITEHDQASALGLELYELQLMVDDLQDSTVAIIEEYDQVWNENADNRYRVLCALIVDRLNGQFNKDKSGAYSTLLLAPLFASMHKYISALAITFFGYTKADIQLGTVREGATLSNILALLGFMQAGMSAEFLKGMPKMAKWVPSLIMGAAGYSLASLALIISRPFTKTMFGCKVNLMVKDQIAAVTGLSNGLIASYTKGLFSVLLIGALTFLTRSFLMGDDDDDDAEYDINGDKVKKRNKKQMDYADIDAKYKDWELYISDFLCNMERHALMFESFLGRHFTEDDSQYFNDEDFWEKRKYLNDGRAFYWKEMLLYNCYRMNVEQMAFNPLYPHEINKEVKGWLKGMIPAWSAIETVLENYKGSTDDPSEIEDLEERAEFIGANFYDRGPYKDLNKYAVKRHKQTPYFRSFETYRDGFTSAKNYEKNRTDSLIKDEDFIEDLTGENNLISF